MARLFIPDARLLLIVGLPASLVAALLLGRRDGLWFSSPVCYVWLTGLLFAFVLRLFVLGRYVLPPDAVHSPEDEANTTPHGWPAMREGVRLLFFHSFRKLLPAGILKNLGFSPIKETPTGLPESFAPYRAGLIPSHWALALGGLNSFSRVAGPGYVRIGPKEKILDIIDLRLQLRTKSVTATTRDGIPLTTTVSALFKLSQPTSSGDNHQNIPYPYAGEALFRLLYADSRQTEEEMMHWSERICPSIEDTLVNEISRYYFDELFRPLGTFFGDEETAPLENIRKTIHNNLNHQLREKFDFDEDEENPIHIVSADFGELSPPPEVIEQRIISWKEDWEREQQRRRIQAETEAIYTRRLAQANAQKQLIDSVIAMIAEIDETPNVDISEVVSLRLLDALDRIIEDGQFVTNGTQETIDQQISNMVMMLSDQLTTEVHQESEHDLTG